MGAIYDLVGEVKLKHSKEVLETLESITRSCDDAHWEVKEWNGTNYIWAHLHLRGYMSGTGAIAMDEIVGDLQPFLLEAARFDYTYDGENGFFYLAKTEEARKIAHSRYLLNEIIVPELEDMTRRDLLTLEGRVKEKLGV